MTLLLEITTAQRRFFYNPAVDECKAFPRTENGIRRAIRKFKKWMASNDFVVRARIVAYIGHYEYYKRDMKPFFTQEISLDGNVEEETIAILSGR